jgi:hypothetical protein
MPSPRARVLAAFALALAAPPLLAQRAPRAFPVHDAKAFFDTIAFSGASFTADESKIVLTTDLSGVFNACTIPVAGGKPEPLTKSTTNGIFAVSAFPGEFTQVWSYDLASGRAAKSCAKHLGDIAAAAERGDATGERGGTVLGAVPPATWCSRTGAPARARESRASRGKRRKTRVRRVTPGRQLHWPGTCIKQSTGSFPFCCALHQSSPRARLGPTARRTRSPTR